jgi:hypothetical protein
LEIFGFTRIVAMRVFRCSKNDVQRSSKLTTTRSLTG